MTRRGVFANFIQTTVFTYVALFILCSPFLFFLKFQFFLLDPLTEFFASAFNLTLQPPVRPNGSGDTLRDYMQLPVIAIVSITVGLVSHSIRKNPVVISNKTACLVRYFLATMLLLYGSIKFGKGQFPYPSFNSLQQPAGNMSPMGLLWFFMGYSSTYNYFAGLMEIVPGLLLLSRRAAPLASILALGVTLNIFFLNMSYDVPVKIFSAHLTMMAGYLIWKNRHLVLLLAGLRFSVTRELRILPKRNRIVLWGLNAIVISVFAIYPTYSSYKNKRTLSEEAKDFPLFQRGFHFINERPYSR